MKEYVSIKFRYAYFIASMLIVLMHTGGLQRSWSYGQDFSYNFVTLLVNLGIPALAWFFFSAGYFLFRDYDKDYTRLIKKKWKSLVIPYCIWNTIAYFWYRLVYDMLFTKAINISFKGLLSAYVTFFITPNRVYRSADAGLWTVAMLFTLVVVSPVIHAVLCHKYSIIIIIIAEILVVLGNVNVSSIFYWAPIYCMGSYMALNWKNDMESWLDTKVSFNIRNIVLMCLACCIYVGCVCAYMLEIIPDSILRFVSPFLVLLCMKYVAIPTTINSIFKNCSFFIYVTHGMILNVLIPLVYRSVRNSIPIILVFLIIYIVTCVSEFALYIGLRKICPTKVASISMGGRL